MRFGGALAGTDVALMTATAATSAGDADLSVTQAGSTTNIAATPAHSVVVDYSAGATALTVPTGTGTDFTFDLDGARGDLTEASGHLTIDAFGFFQLDGQFTFTSGLPERPLRRWTSRATSSLPVPLSPRTRTAESVGATRSVTCTINPDTVCPGNKSLLAGASTQVLLYSVFDPPYKLRFQSECLSKKLPGLAVTS